MYFRDIIGQEDVKRQLIASAQKRIVPHARIFYEQHGAGAFPLALAYARYLNCREPSDDDACGHCPSCLKYDELAHPDLHFMFPIVKNDRNKKETCDDYLPQWREMVKGQVYFDLRHWLDAMDAGNTQVLIYSRESDVLIRKFSLRIYEANYRILLVWLPEKLHPTCANKLLKIIEEPPPNTVILMVTEEPGMILGTIQSRAQHLNIRAIQTGDMQSALIRREGLEPEAALQIARLSGGSYLRAMEAISVSEENAFFLERFKEVMRHSWARNVKGMRQLSDLLAGIGRERQKAFLAYCQFLVRENFVYRFQSPEINYMNSSEAGFALNFASYINERNVSDLVDELSKAELHISQNVNAKMVFFDLSLHITVLIRR
ncbi:MAG: DNA polymerase III subunit delta [Tannerellaceae bacterium]|jgi:DNA polymerase-3 subunit delta'|nr:DNA polymerase III subunit delta [Tannerellaceae bacterium]